MSKITEKEFKVKVRLNDDDTIDNIEIRDNKGIHNCDTIPEASDVIKEIVGIEKSEAEEIVGKAIETAQNNG